MWLVSSEYGLGLFCSCFPSPFGVLFLFVLLRPSCPSPFAFSLRFLFFVFLFLFFLSQAVFLSCSSCIFFASCVWGLVIAVVSFSVFLGTHALLVDLSSMPPIVPPHRFSCAFSFFLCSALAGVMLCPVLLAVSFILFRSPIDSFG